MRQSEETTLWEQARRRIQDGVFLPVSESQKRAKNVGTECKVKKRLWVKIPAQNRNVRGKNVTEKPGKSKATKSSEGRAQSWWRSSRAWEARVECHWQGKVIHQKMTLSSIENQNAQVDRASDETINKTYAEHKQRELNKKGEKKGKGLGKHFFNLYSTEISQVFQTRDVSYSKILKMIRLLKIKWLTLAVF